ncbi:NPCBM/NEW2 domain-containing protein [Deinococcus radiopugnans]|uniref:Delta-60 repeat protein n=1 Tax=Deinococcus radiopugnans ATCC 19172 TaxID=585398 RepID=A0A5C4YBM6_9DEIO|nr:NPCBM/NEW2 domain-containing protein [Deinococcus radiopugnans]MBB6015763.1 putative delta-60 repeat protein [Deinococcus radiopugnans ATCC 19172]TNM72553.1 hypothetical protein FHR04_01590 [Deinococcus radiopugnans ATCC 19172]
MSTPFVPLLLGCAALLLVSCSPKPAPPGPPDDGRPADSPYTGGRQYPWSDRLAPHGADAYADGHRYPWRSPTAASGLDSRPTENGHNLLSALPWTSATNGWGPVERDRSNGWQASGDGTTLKVGGRTFASGLGVHADSEIRYALGGQCQTFTASVGVDDEVGPRGSVRFNVFGDDTLLSGGEVRRGGESALPIEVGVTGVQELRLEVRGGEDNHYDHADWGDAAVECTAAAPDNDITLSRLAYVSASNGWGPVELDRSNGPQGLRDGGPLTVAGQAFATGLGVHAPSTLEYDLGGVCTTFSAQLGVDDETGGRGSVTFQVSGDGRTLYDSAVVRGHDPVTPARVDVTGIHALKLTVTDGGDGLNHDHADWAGARLDCGTSAPGRAGTPDPSFGTGGRADAGGVDVVAEDGGAVVVLDANFGVTRLSPSGAVLGQGTARLNGEASALARQPDGGLIAVGHADGQMTALRYRPDLSLDSAFGQGGVVRLELGVADHASDGDPVRSAATDVAAQPDGRVVLVGYAARPYSPVPDVTLSDDDFAVVRLDRNGAPDPAFGQGGVTTTTLNGRLGATGDSADRLYSAALQPDGRIVVAGEAHYDANNYSAVVARYRADGTLDPAFAQGGLAFGDLGGRNTFHAVALEPDGTIVAGGGTRRFFTSALLQRFSADGVAGPAVNFQFKEPDNPLAYQTVVTTLAAQDDGHLLLGGFEDGYTYVARFSASLTQDLNFGDAPQGNVPVSPGLRIALATPAGRSFAVTTAQTTASGTQGQGTLRLFY